MENEKRKNYKINKIEKTKNKINKKIIIIGLIAGFINGFFSTGGGLILIPAFMYLLEKNSKIARGTTIFCILPMALTSSIFYYKNSYINWKISILCALGGIIGGYIGSKLLNKISEVKLKIIFVIFLLYVALKIIFS